MLAGTSSERKTGVRCSKGLEWDWSRNQPKAKSFPGTHRLKDTGGKVPQNLIFSEAHHLPHGAGCLSPGPWGRVSESWAMDQAIQVMGRNRSTYRGKMAVIKAEA